MKRLGFAQIPLMIALLLMALAVPVATKLVQNNQDTRNKAAHSCVGEGGPVYSGSGSCCENLEMGDCAGSGSFKVCYCKKKATNPTVTPAYRNCTTWTWSNNVCTKSEYQRASNLACLPSNCTVNDPTPRVTLAVPTLPSGIICCCNGASCGLYRGTYCDYPRQLSQNSCNGMPTPGVIITGPENVTGLSTCGGMPATLGACGSGGCAATQRCRGRQNSTDDTQYYCFPDSTCAPAKMCAGTGQCRSLPGSLACEALPGIFTDCNSIGQVCCKVAPSPTVAPIPTGYSCCCTTSDPDYKSGCIYVAGSSCPSSHSWYSSNNRCSGEPVPPTVTPAVCTATSNRPLDCHCAGNSQCASGFCKDGRCTVSCAGDGETAYSGHSCCAGLEQYDCVANGSFSTCKCRVRPTNPTATPAFRNCTTRTWNGNKCEVRTYQRASNLACDPSNCSPADPTPTTPAGTARCCPKVDTTYAINTCTGASQNACGINSNYCEWKTNGNCSITIPIVTPIPQTCCDSCPGGTCNGSKSGNTWLHLDDACSAACICGTYHQTDNGNYACGTGRIDEPTVTPAPPTPTSAICMTPIGAKATPTVIQGTCSGNRPADVCGNTNLKVSAQCYNGSWDYDEQLCNSKGRVEFCGGKTYCCPSNGGNWTNDMTNCSQPCGACTQCPNDALAKGKGDADCSGSVTINDASVWRAEFISGLFGTVSKTTWEADFDCDGKVTLNDISIWRSNFIKSLNN